MAQLGLLLYPMNTMVTSTVKISINHGEIGVMFTNIAMDSPHCNCVIPNWNGIGYMYEPKSDACD